MNQKDISCPDMGVKIMALIDGELDRDEIILVQEHLKTCKRCSAEYASLKRVKEVTNEMKFKNLPEFYWDDYWKHIYNRLERGLSWIFLSLGAIIILTSTGWQFIDHLISDKQIHPLLKVGIFIFLIGLAVLIVSVVREKLMVRRVDKYRKVER